MSRFSTYVALWLACALGALAAPAHQPMVKVYPGWHAEIVAEAPAISAPSVVCCAPDGRIFMGQDLMDMGSPTDKPGDRILCIHPDGKITVFATNLYAVFGLQYIDGKVYVHHTPKFSVFDDDHSVGVNRRDLIANDNPHPWLPSFNDHIPSGFHLAMDGYFYISTGDKGILGAVGTDGRKIEMRGGIYRMRPDGTGLEVYCTGTRNHLDIALDPQDEMFTDDNTDDGGGWWQRITHMVDGGYYGYPYDYRPRKPYTLWMMTDYASAGGAPTGALCYNEDALPEEYHGNLFLCDWAGACVERFLMKRDGSTFDFISRVGRKIPTSGADADGDFITRGDFDIRFRPVGICLTPDGLGFYVTDWGISGWKNSQVLGRLFKVTYTGKSLAAPKPSWYIPAATGQKFKATTSELVAALSHPSQMVRMVAQRRLADRHQAAAGKLAALLSDTRATNYARWSAIWALDAIDGGKSKHKAILAALQDKDWTVQAQAARELGTRQSRDAVHPLINMLDSTNAALRFRAATALGRIGDPVAIMPLRVALAQTDLFARYAAFKGLNRIGRADPAAWPQIADALDSVRPAIREGALFAIRETYDVGLTKALRGFLAKPTIPTEPRTNVLNLLASLYLKQAPWNGDWWSTMPVNGSPPPKTERWEGSPVVAAAMHDTIVDSSAAMRQIAFDWVRTSHDTNQVALLRTMHDRETNDLIRAGILRALPADQGAGTRALIEPILKNPKTSVPLKEAAIEMAESIGGPALNEDLIHLAEDQSNDQIVKELYQGFGQHKVAAAAPLLGRNLVNSNYSVRLAAVAALTQIGGDLAIAQFMPGLDDPSADIRGQSIDALGALRAKQAVPRLIQLCASKADGVAAMQSLTEIHDLAALNIYVAGLTSKNASLRSMCKTAILNIRDLALPRLEAKLAPTNTLSDDTIAGLRQIYDNSPAAKKGPLFNIRLKTTPLEEYQAFAAGNPGDAKKGQKIFTDINGVNCIRCHRIKNVGAQIGPDLTGIGMRQSRAQIIESVLYPSRQIMDGYQQIFFTMKDDTDYAGIIRSETPAAVTIIDNLGKTNVLEKSNIATRKTSKLSLMPDGLQTGLSLVEFSDLIAYVDIDAGTPVPRPIRPVTPPLRARTEPHPSPPPAKPAPAPVDVFAWPDLTMAKAIPDPPATEAAPDPAPALASFQPVVHVAPVATPMPAPAAVSAPFHAVIEAAPVPPGPPAPPPPPAPPKQSDDDVRPVAPPPFPPMPPGFKGPPPPPAH